MHTQFVAYYTIFGSFEQKLCVLYTKIDAILRLAYIHERNKDYMFATNWARETRIWIV